MHRVNCCWPQHKVLIAAYEVVLAALEDAPGGYLTPEELLKEVNGCG